ncbi:biotin--[acetyl-CoA-carboxylase] ligase [Pseudaquabacterium pictum]|uniref:biotin--[biotin carboxyl-carrier protein] ligase n=1 Tax=Pseudaquabacterium pictum TaxID=2315236 RepID=A0A480AY84_9BURK|nr:biotin--[acetyl-CoA-carboxylase] ligase [Rubrivivax pictus]GCL66271.1 biotin--[acetyl-CoA-carboxylase] ligase [Rubrivivax pictus]
MSQALAPAPLRWGAEDLWLALQPLLPGLTVEVVASIGSTNTELLARARQSPADGLKPALLVAEQQTAGRGRQGKAWQSAAGASLTFSLALPLAPADWSGLSLAVGLALADALDPLAADTSPRLGLKWPNDLVLLDDGGRAAHIGRKLGGILIETVQLGQQRLAVLGIGLNILPLPPHDPANPAAAAPVLSWGHASVQELQPGLDAPATLSRVLPPLVRAMQAFDAQGFAPLQAAFARRDVLSGRAVATTLPGLPHGRADGVDATGTLWLQTGAGRQPVASGEVSLRPLDAAAPPPC